MRQAPTLCDRSRRPATTSSLFRSSRFRNATRPLQRYCASGHLDAQKIATTLGDKYLITSLSVARRIAEIQELGALDNVATDSDMARHTATPENEMSRYVVCLEGKWNRTKTRAILCASRLTGLLVMTITTHVFLPSLCEIAISFTAHLELGRQL